MEQVKRENTCHMILIDIKNTDILKVKDIDGWADFMAK